MNRYRMLSGLGTGLAVILLCLTLRPIKAADITFFGLYKRQVFIQTNAGPAGPRCSPFMFDAIVELADSNSISAAALAGPAGTQTALTASEEKEFMPSRWFSWTCDSFVDQASLEAAWQSGKYTFFVFGKNDPSRTISLTLAGDAYPSNAPHLQNFVEAQAVDPAKDFVLRWDPLAEGTTNDLVFVSVRNMADQTTVFNTPFLKGDGALDGTATFTIIPAGTLVPGIDYDVYVRFDKVRERNTEIPGVLGLASYASGTHFTLKTNPLPAGS